MAGAHEDSAAPSTRPRAGHGVAWGWLVLWLAFATYAALLAPPEDAALTKALVKGAFTGSFGSTDPSIAAVFSMLGVVPVLVSSFLLRDGATRRLPAWPFALASFAIGAFAILPYLALRRVGGPRAEVRRASIVRRGLAHIVAKVGIVVALVALSAWGFIAGNPGIYAAAFRSVALVHVMTLDLMVCTALLCVLVEESRSQTGFTGESRIARAVRLVPLFGSAVWNAIVTRPP